MATPAFVARRRTVSSSQASSSRAPTDSTLAALRPGDAQRHRAVEHVMARVMVREVRHEIAVALELHALFRHGGHQRGLHERRDDALRLRVEVVEIVALD